VLERRGFGVGPGQKLVDLAVEVAVDDPCKRGGEIGMGIDAGKLAVRLSRPDAPM